MSTILNFYSNCSLGGVVTVMINRLKYEKDHHSFIFINDLGGSQALLEAGANFVRIENEDSSEKLINFLLNTSKYDEVHFFSHPELFNKITKKAGIKYVFEVHSGVKKYITQTLKKIEFSETTYIVPSNYSKKILLDYGVDNNKVFKKNNIVDTNLFNCESSSHIINFQNKIPVMWVGRYDKLKNFNDFVRVLSLLGDEYIGIAITSGSIEEKNMGDAINISNLYNCNIIYLHNISNMQLSRIYKQIRSLYGVYCSTSLCESFGFSILESLLCGVPTFIFHLEAPLEYCHKFKFDISISNIGDFVDMANNIKLICKNKYHYQRITENNKNAFLIYKDSYNKNTY